MLNIMIFLYFFLNLDDFQKQTVKFPNFYRKKLTSGFWDLRFFEKKTKINLVKKNTG